MAFSFLPSNIKDTPDLPFFIYQFYRKKFTLTCLRKLNYNRLCINLVIILFALFNTGCGGLNQTIEQPAEISADNPTRTPYLITPEIIVPTVTFPNPTKTITPSAEPTQLQWTNMLGPSIGVSVYYPEDWSIIRGSKQSDSDSYRLSGESGFIQLRSMDADSIEEAVDILLNNEIQIFGSQPVIEVLQIQGQDARLIVPSTDQAFGREGETAMIIRFPKPVYVCNPYCRYLVLWSDVDHIREIAKTIRFVGK